VFRVFTSDHPPFELPHHGGGAPFLTGALLSVIALIPVFMVWNRMPRTVAQAPVENGVADAAPVSSGEG
jgi:hypothetical protein